MLVAFVVAFVISFIIYKDEKEEDPVEKEGEKEVKTLIDDKEVLAPLSGKVVPLREVPDETFASGILGKGCAIEPDEGKVYAPVDGVISVAYETKHAIGITGDNGAELLIHVGLNTVELNGEHFTSHITEGQRVKKGDLLLEFDLEAIAKNYKTVTPILISNPDDFSEILVEDVAEVKPGDKLLAVLR